MALINSTISTDLSYTTLLLIILSNFKDTADYFIVDSNLKAELFADTMESQFQTSPISDPLKDEI